MEKLKRIDWLEFIFQPQAKIHVPEGYRMDLVAEKYLNNDMHCRYEVVNTSSKARPVRYVVYQSQNRGTYLVQWSGSIIPYDPLNAMQELAKFFNIELTEITIKRIDIAFDLGCEMPILNEHIPKTRARDYTYSASNAQTHYFGKSPCRVRIYNKIAQMQKKRPDKLQEYLELTNFDSKEVTRVEFELRSDALRKRGIATGQDLLDHLTGLESYLVKKWFWIPLNAHKGKQQFSPFWSEVVSLVDEAYHPDAIEKQPADCSKLKKNGFSVLASAYVGSLTKDQKPSKEGYIDFVYNNLLDFEPREAEWAKFWESKR